MRQTAERDGAYAADAFPASMIQSGRRVPRGEHIRQLCDEEVHASGLFVPDATALLKFRHLLEEYDLQKNCSRR
jgi:hypothetical protein